ncbi:hypothetical protein CBL_10769 [Carabus blaptoides fortunei]
MSPKVGSTVPRKAWETKTKKSSTQLILVEVLLKVKACNYMQLEIKLAGKYCTKERGKNGIECSIKSGSKAVNYNVRVDKLNHFILQRSEQRRCQVKNCKSRPRTYC